MSLVITREEWNPQPAVDAVDELAPQALEASAQVILDAAVERVPFDTGALSDSGHLETLEDGSVAVVFDADYARPVRARGSALGGRSARWLDEAFEMRAGDAGQAMEETFRSGWPDG